MPRFSALLLALALAAPALHAQSRPGMPRPLADAARGVGADASAAQSLTQAVARALVEEDRLTVPEASTFDCHGCAVALLGDRALVGAYDDDDAGVGGAYVFVRDGDGWALQQRLVSPDSAPGDGFGVAVALFGDRALVGADVAASPEDESDPGANIKGAAYVFHFDGASWRQEDRLSVPDALFDGPGSSVALSDDMALVGYPEDGAGAARPRSASRHLALGPCAWPCWTCSAVRSP